MANRYLHTSLWETNCAQHHGQSIQFAGESGYRGLVALENYSRPCRWYVATAWEPALLIALKAKSSATPRFGE